MTIELLQTLSMGSAILSGVLLVLAIVLFFVLDIRVVIGDVTGSTQRKAIDEIRKQNEESGDKAYKPSPVNTARGKLTDKITYSGKLQQMTGKVDYSAGTEKLNTTELVNGINETTVLDIGTGETTVLSDASVRFGVDMEVSFLGSYELIE